MLRSDIDWLIKFLGWVFVTSIFFKDPLPSWSTFPWRQWMIPLNGHQKIKDNKIQQKIILLYFKITITINTGKLSFFEAFFNIIFESNTSGVAIPNWSLGRIEICGKTAKISKNHWVFNERLGHRNLFLGHMRPPGCKLATPAIQT